MVFAGDELGVEGFDQDVARRPMPWDEQQWDRQLFEAYRDLIAIRRASHGLCHGGLRWLHAGDDVLVFLRESREERVLVQVSRAGHPPLMLAPSVLAGARAELLYGQGDLVVQGDAVFLPDDGPAVHLWRLDP
jgi:alpha-glucosidase